MIKEPKKDFKIEYNNHINYRKVEYTYLRQLFDKRDSKEKNMI